MWGYNKRNGRLGYTYGFKTMSKTTAYRKYIKNYEFETREFFEWGTKNIQLTLPMDMVT